MLATISVVAQFPSLSIIVVVNPFVPVPTVSSVGTPRFSLEFYNCNVALFAIDAVNKKLVFAASTAPQYDIYINVLNFYG